MQDRFAAVAYDVPLEPRAQPSILPAAVKVLLASLRSTLTAEAEGWVFGARGKACAENSWRDWPTWPATSCQAQQTDRTSVPEITIAGFLLAHHARGMPGVQLKTIKHLFATAANRCCHPGCEQAMVTDEGVVVGEVCHITASRPDGPRYNPNLSAEERDSFANLILFCPTHHKIADSDPGRYTPELLQDLKQMAAKRRFVELSPADAKKAERLFEVHIQMNVGGRARVNVEHAQTIHAQTVKVARKGKVAKAAHPDSVAADLEMSGYIKYLIERYQKFQHADQDKAGRGKYVIIYNAIKREFGRAWGDVSRDDFGRLAEYLQGRIRNSKMGRILGARGNRLFSTFAEWKVKPEAA